VGGVQTGDSLKGKIMWIWRLGALCLVESGVIIWLSGFLCSSIRFHRKQQVEIQQLRESVTHWRNMARTLDDDRRNLESEFEELRRKNHSCKHAIDLIATINKSCKDFHDSITPF
jgi:hypothetical protein